MRLLQRFGRQFGNYGEFVICTNNCICQTIYILDSQWNNYLRVDLGDVYYVESMIIASFLYRFEHLYKLTYCMFNRHFYFLSILLSI